MNKRIKESIRKLGELADSNQTFSQFEKNFVQDTAARIRKWGDAAYMSDKQVALIDRMYAERITQAVPAQE